MEINTFVFFDLETTGLPYQERNQTKIIELSMIAASRQGLLTTEHGSIPPVSKITIVFNPQRRINPAAVKLTGLSNKLLQHAPVFRQKINSLVAFLADLPKPVCLVAHNGNSFDFKILLAEFKDAGKCLPPDLLCVDSLQGFRKLKNEFQNVTPVLSDLMTDDEDEWESQYSPEEWDEMWLSVDNSDEAEELRQRIKKDVRSRAISKTFSKKSKTVLSKDSFKLTSIYSRLLGSEPVNAHRAEEDCSMLMKCVVVLKDFIQWADGACKHLSQIQPLNRY